MKKILKKIDSNIKLITTIVLSLTALTSMVIILGNMIYPYISEIINSNN